jgi:hypothetical protein
VLKYIADVHIMYCILTVLPPYSVTRDGKEAVKGTKELR